MITIHDPRLTPKSQIFSHVDPETGQLRHFAASIMYDHAVKVKKNILSVYVNPADIDMLISQRDVNIEYAKSLSKEQCNQPIVFCAMPSDLFLMVDGHHRYVRKFLDKEIEIQAYLFLQEEWEQFLVELPGSEEMQKRVLVDAFVNKPKVA